MARQDVLLVLLVASTLHATSAKTAYDLLERYNLPRGLLPQGVKSYHTSFGGAVEVTLSGECNFFVTIAGKQQYKLRYDSTVRGVLHRETIAKVSGVSIQFESHWVGINEIIRLGDLLTIHAYHYMWPVPVSAFASSPRCD